MSKLDNTVYGPNPHEFHIGEVPKDVGFVRRARLDALEAVARAAEAYRAAEETEIDYSQPGAMPEPLNEGRDMDDYIFAAPTAAERELGERIERTRLALDAALAKLAEVRRG